jgi:LacI family transcriptional regulator
MKTAKDVANRLGLAVSTVGRALSDDPRISAETKARVAEVAAELGYTPNRAARMIRGTSSDVIGLMVPDIRVGLHATIAHALGEALSGSGFRVVLAETDNDPARELQQVRGLSAARVAGAVIMPTEEPLPETTQLLTGLRHVQILRHQPAFGGQLYGIDDSDAVQRATAHLIALGHQQIAYVGGPPNLPTDTARLAGFRAALAAAGLPDNPGLIDLGTPFSAEHGARAVSHLLVGDQPPTALVCGSVEATRGALDELLAQGVEVPTELSVVGFGDEPGWSWWGPGLTTMALPVHRLASAAALRLLHRLTTFDDPAGQPPDRIWPCPLVVRGSTARPPWTAAITPKAAAPTATPVPFSNDTDATEAAQRSSS